VVPGNPQQHIDLWTKLPTQTSNHEEKRILIGSSDLIKEQTYDFTGTLIDGHVTPRLLAMVRIIQMVPEEFTLENENAAVLGNLVSVRNERAAYVSLRALLIARLGPCDVVEVRDPLSDCSYYLAI
jgi:hypothetical protein